MGRTVNRRRGSLMLEFTLVGIPTLFLTVSTVEVSLAMWEYHTLEECATVGARYVITHGADCAGSCTATVGNVISKIVATGVGLNPADLSVTLTSASGPTTYTPASSYTSNTTVFPPAADATVGNDWPEREQHSRCRGVISGPHARSFFLGQTISSPSLASE